MKTKTEELFETYLRANGYPVPNHEQSTPGLTKKPDWRIPWYGEDIVVDAKEREYSSPLGLLAHGDPYKGVRKMIVRAEEKFTQYKCHNCAVVVANLGDWQTDLCPQMIFGAMLGDFGIAMRISSERQSRRVEITSSFDSRRAKMVRHTTGEFYNQHISAVIALKQVRLKNSEYDLAVAEELENLRWSSGCLISMDAQASVYLAVAERMRTEWEVGVRVVICENPGAARRFPQDLFACPLDERWAIKDSYLTRVYAGRRISEIEGKK